jgi:hypothetical protein
VSSKVAVTIVCVILVLFPFHRFLLLHKNCRVAILLQFFTGLRRVHFLELGDSSLQPVLHHIT